MAIRSYYYNQQLRKAAMVFANVFAGMKVRTGKDGCGNVAEIEVPIRYGSTDRVVASIGSNHSQNNLHTLPMMSCYLTGIATAPERQKGIGSTDRRTYLPQGGVFPDDVQVIKRVMPIPYNLTFELSIYASNTDQAFQMIEQIMMLFDYEVQIQFNDAAFDWSKISRVILDGSFTNETNYPVGTDRQILVWSASFTLEVWISPPMEVRDDIIKSIHVRIGQANMPFAGGYDADGNPIDFDQLDELVIDASNIGPMTDNPSGPI